jgi:pimeloyl-ACP methyl ester carboxylesterase
MPRWRPSVATLERLLQNAETVFGIERSEEVANWCPTEAALAAVQVPGAVLMGRESAEFFGEMANWLAPRLNALVITAPGGHAAYFDHAPELAETLRPVLRRWSLRSSAASAFTHRPIGLILLGRLQYQRNSRGASMDDSQAY